MQGKVSEFRRRVGETRVRKDLADGLGEHVGEELGVGLDDARREAELAVAHIPVVFRSPDSSKPFRDGLAAGKPQEVDQLGNGLSGECNEDRLVVEWRRQAREKD